MTSEKLKLALRAVEFLVWLAETRTVAPGEGDDPEIVARWTAAKQLAEMAYTEPPELTAEGLIALAKQRPGLFGLACRLRGKVQSDPAIDEMAKLAVWAEIADDPAAARQALEAFLGAS